MIYKGKSYPAEWIYVEGFGEELVSVESLEEALMPNDMYADEEARWLDEQIFFYVPDEEWETEDLCKLVSKYVD